MEREGLDEKYRRILSEVEARERRAGIDPDPDLSEANAQLVQKMKAREARFEAEARRYWAEEYPRLPFEAKVMRWLPDVHRGMRYQGEATGDEYSQFSARWYEGAKEVEPEIDRIMEAVVPRLGFEFDWAEYRRRISGEVES